MKKLDYEDSESKHSITGARLASSYEGMQLVNASETSAAVSEKQIAQWKVWAQLVRLPNVFTIIADVSAAFLFTASSIQPWDRFVCVVLGGVSLYWAGMILNDVFDAEIDAQQRSKRPIPQGWIDKRQASIGGWLLLILGIGLATVSGYLSSSDVPTTSLPCILSFALAIMIIAYNGPLKRTIFAPATMGSCRLLSFLLGASPCIALAASESKPLGGLIPAETVGIAIGFGIYIMGVTTMARREATGGSRQHLVIGGLITALGAVCLAMAPQTSPGMIAPRLDTKSVFPLLISMIVLPVLMRAIRAVRSPSPQRIQFTIKAGILTIIPLAAAFAALGAGPMWGMAIFSLVAPSLLLSARFRVT